MVWKQRVTRVGDDNDKDYCQADVVVIELVVELSGLGMTIPLNITAAICIGADRSVVFCAKMIDDVIDR